MITSNFFFFALILHIFIVIRNGKIDKSRNMGGIVVIFLWTWNIWGGCKENASKQRKMVAFVRNYSVKMTWGCFSHFLLLWLWCQRFWGSSEDRYRSKRLSRMLLVCYSLLNSQNISINNSGKRLITYFLGYLRRS